MNKKTIIIVTAILLIGITGVMSVYVYGGKKDADTSVPPVAIVASSTVETTADDSWEGDWVGSYSPWVTGDLKITKETKEGFEFTMEALSGGNSGSINNENGDAVGAKFIDKNNAVFEQKIEDVYHQPSDVIENDDNGICRIHFERIGSKIKTSQTNSCSYFAGMGVYFEFDNFEKNGVKATPSIADLEVLKTKEQQNAFSTLVGEDLTMFTDTAMMTGTLDDLDGLNGDIEVYGVAHLGNSVGSMIMITGTNIWAAVIDPSGKDIVWYFTNVPAWKNKAPKTIEAWAEDMGKSVKIKK